jgi:radical SAM protein with 4Fe4S-binding SPASM domain
MRELANRYTDRFAINLMVLKQLPGVVSEAELCRLSPKECIDVDINNALYYNELSKKKKVTEIPAQEQKKPRDYGIDVPPKVIACLAAKASYTVAWDGRMLPCPAFNALATYPFEEGFKQAWDRLPTLFDDVKHPDECIGCRYFQACPNCPAYFHAETGEYNKVSEYICRLAHERNERYNELNRARAIPLS